MDASFLDLLAHCGSGPLALHGGLFLGLFAAGLAGSAFHCAPMCGGFVLGQVSDRMARLPASHLCEWRRTAAGALLPYHLGRITTYAALGALAGLSAGGLSSARWLHGLSALLLTLAAGVFLLQATGQKFTSRGAAALWAQPLARLARRFRNGGFGLGLVLGLLPCGLIYGALLAASAAADPLAGAAAMAAFGLGTVPALVLVGIVGQAAGHRWRRTVQAMSPVLIGFSAVLLLSLAVSEVRTFVVT